MSKVSKTIVTIVIVVVFIALFAVIVGVCGDAGYSTPGPLSLILFFGMIGAIRAVWKSDKNPGMDTTAQMQDINEAYNILKDPVTRARYDAEYARFNSTRFEWQKSAPKEEVNYDIKDETLKEDIKEARKAAEDYVREFYASLKNDTKKAARGAWDEMR